MNCKAWLPDGSDLLSEEMKIGMEFYIHCKPSFCDFTKNVNWDSTSITAKNVENDKTF